MPFSLINTIHHSIKRAFARFFIPLFAVFFLTGAAAWAVTVKNVSDEPIEVTRYGETVVIPPKGLDYISESTANEPWFRQLVRSREVVIVNDPKQQIQPKLSEAYCRSDDYPDDASYCFLDLAVQEAAPMYCVMGMSAWSSIKECLYYVNQKRKLTTNDCLVFDPGSTDRQNCIDYVKSGIPSKPGLSYEDSLK